MSKAKNKQSLAAAFGEAVCYIRDVNCMTQDQLAKASKLDRSYISQVERGIKNVTLNTVYRIAIGLRVSPLALLRFVKW